MKNDVDHDHGRAEAEASRPLQEKAEEIRDNFHEALNVTLFNEGSPSDALRCWLT